MASKIQPVTKPVHQIHFFMQHRKNQRALLFPEEVENVVMLGRETRNPGRVFKNSRVRLPPTYGLEVSFEDRFVTSGFFYSPPRDRISAMT